MLTTTFAALVLLPAQGGPPPTPVINHWEKIEPPMATTQFVSTLVAMFENTSLLTLIVYYDENHNWIDFCEEISDTIPPPSPPAPGSPTPLQVPSPPWTTHFQTIGANARVYQMLVNDCLIPNQGCDVRLTYNRLAKIVAWIEGDGPFSPPTPVYVNPSSEVWEYQNLDGTPLLKRRRDAGKQFGHAMEIHKYMIRPDGPGGTPIGGGGLGG